jgi:hypothetical protein
MTKHVGIVACSAEGAALCYRTVCSEAPAAMGEHMHPEVSLHTHPLGEYMQYIYEDDWSGIAPTTPSATTGDRPRSPCGSSSPPPTTAPCRAVPARRRSAGSLD